MCNMTPATTIARRRMKTLLAGLSSAEREGFVKVADAFAEGLESTLAAGDAQLGTADYQPLLTKPSAVGVARSWARAVQGETNTRLRGCTSNSEHVMQAARGAVFDLLVNA